jgi:hypothetical protein
MAKETAATAVAERLGHMTVTQRHLRC